MNKRNPEEKRILRADKYLKPLLQRREFLTAVGIAGVGLPFQGKETKPSDLTSRMVIDMIKNSDDALIAAYMVFYEAADENVEDHNAVNFWAGVGNGWPGTGDTTMGPAKGRPWLLWRLRGLFRRKFKGTLAGPDPGPDLTAWHDEANYVCANAAYIGSKSRQAAGGKMVKKAHIMQVLEAISKNAAEKKNKDGRVKIFDLWCSL